MLGLGHSDDCHNKVIEGGSGILLLPSIPADEWDNIQLFEDSDAVGRVDSSRWLRMQGGLR